MTSQRSKVSFEEEVIDRLARIETKLETLADHEHRLRSVERRQYALAGVATFLAPVLQRMGVPILH